MEFLDFSRRHDPALRYLVFNSRFTTYAQLARLDRADIRLVTVRRRDQALRAKADALPKDSLRSIQVPTSTAMRFVSAHEKTVPLGGLGGHIRQITILRITQRRPVLYITNDFDSSLFAIMHCYTRRWLVEQSISGQLSFFFHLSRLHSSMAIKVDFNLAMTGLTYNLLRLIAIDVPPGSQRLPPRSL